MTTGHKVTVGLAVALAILSIIATVEYLREHDARIKRDAEVQIYARQATDLQAKNVAVTAQAKSDVVALEAKRKSVKTTSQVVAALPGVLSLPVPVHEVTKEEAALPDSPVSNGDVLIPAASVKPLYDAQVTCKEDAVNLVACEKKFANDEEIIAAKDKIIAADTVAVSGGTKWKRVKSAGKWLLLGAAAGAVTVAVLHH